jgi:peptidoglycan/xylan/chitin deacetylase (PgdA/CDA1 family)
MTNAGSTRRGFLEAAAGTVGIGAIGVGASVVSVSGERTHSRPPTALQQTDAGASFGHVVLTFDHAAPSVYGTAFPILREFGYPALLAVVTDRIPPTGRSPLGLDRLRELRSAGWEIGSHSASEHPDFTSLSEEAIASQCRQAKQWLLDNGFAEEAASIAYPYASANERVANVVRKYFDLGFGGPNPHGTEITEPLLIGRVNGDDVGATREAIDAVAANGEVLAIMYHTVGVDNGRVGTSAFRETMEYVRSRNENLRVITPSTLVELLSGESAGASANRTGNGTAQSTTDSGSGPTTGSPSTAATDARTSTMTETPSPAPASSPTRTPSTTRTPSPTATETSTATPSPTDTRTTTDRDTATVASGTDRSTTTRTVRTTAERETSAATPEPAGTGAERTVVDSPGFGVLAALSGAAGWTAYRLTRGSDE